MNTHLYVLCMASTYVIGIVYTKGQALGTGELWRWGTYIGNPAWCGGGSGRARGHSISAQPNDMLMDYRELLLIVRCAPYLCLAYFRF